ncbi:MAG: YciI family protein [Chloroflexi bacterium]|nr:YciI family protein [Chloroflexota bacterium]
MQYMLLIYGSEAASASMSQAEQEAEMAEYFAYTHETRAGGVFVGAEALHDTVKATTVRVREGKTVTSDGPFAETKEQLGGYYLLDCKDLDEAIKWAAKLPGARRGAIEIRPVVVFS